MASFRFDGQSIPIQEGDSVASALYRAGQKVISRSLKYHRPRGMYCNAGNCAGCLVGVDGVPNVLACMTPARAGSRVVSQNRWGSAQHDLLGVVDKVFPQSFDPHNSFTRPAWLNALFLKAVRTMSGLGRVPVEEARHVPVERHVIRVDELVVGAGAAGLARAKQAARRGQVLVVDEGPGLGGSARWNPLEVDTRMAAIEAPSWRNATFWTQAICFGLYRDPALRRAMVAAIHHKTPEGPRLVEVSARRVTIAVGGYDAWPTFTNNDLPGVLSLRGALRLLGEHRVLPGRAVVVDGRLPRLAAALMENAGCRIVAQGTVEAVHGAFEVESATVSGERVSCDAVVVVAPRLPRLELFQQAGCRIGARSDRLEVLTDHQGATTHPQIFSQWEGTAW